MAGRKNKKRSGTEKRGRKVMSDNVRAYTMFGTGIIWSEATHQCQIWVSDSRSEPYMRCYTPRAKRSVARVQRGATERSEFKKNFSSANWPPKLLFILSSRLFSVNKSVFPPSGDIKYSKRKCILEYQSFCSRNLLHSFKENLFI